MQSQTLEDIREFGECLFNYPMNYDASNAAEILPLPNNPTNLKKSIMPLPGFLQKVARRYVDLVPFENYQIAEKDNMFNGFSYNTDKILGMESILENDIQKKISEDKKEENKKEHKHNHNHKNRKHHKHHKHKDNKDNNENDSNAEDSKEKDQEKKKDKTDKEQKNKKEKRSKKYQKFKNKKLKNINTSDESGEESESLIAKNGKNKQRGDKSYQSTDNTYEDSMAILRDKFKFKYTDYDKVDSKYNSRNIINLAYITKNKKYNENHFVIIDDSEYDLEEPSDVEGTIKKNEDEDELNDELPAILEILSKPSTVHRTPNRFEIYN